MEQVPMTGLPTLVFFAGPKGSGKDTAAKRLFATHPTWRHMNFADPIKRALAEFYGFTDHELHDPKGKEEPFSEMPNIIPRVEMVELAKWAISRHGGGIFAENWKRRVMAGEAFYKTETFHVAKASPVVVCTDLRRPDEVEVIKEFLGSTQVRIFYVHNPRVEELRRVGRLSGDVAWTDDSESHAEYLREICDHVIPNLGSLQDLYTEVDNIAVPNIPLPLWFTTNNHHNHNHNQQG